MAARKLPSRSRSVRFGAETIPYTLSFSQRKTLRIAVHPDASVSVAAPLGRSVDEVDERVRRRAHWMFKQREYFSGFLPKPAEKLFRSGETFYYLGRQYRLKVIKGQPRKVSLEGRFLKVSIPEGGQLFTRGMVLDWLRRRANDVFSRRLERCYEQVKRYKIPFPELRVLPMKRRWGSYPRAGKIILNLNLVHAPTHCIDYVIIHELIHALVPNHGLRFLRLMFLLLPDWEARKARLEDCCWF